jgi:hypothetical protein
VAPDEPFSIPSRPFLCFWITSFLVFPATNSRFAVPSANLLCRPVVGAKEAIYGLREGRMVFLDQAISRGRGLRETGLARAALR